MAERTVPTWRYHPNGEARIFQPKEDIPSGWHETREEAARPPKPKPEPLPPEVVAEVISKFDHDGDGKPGGSRPRKKPLLDSVKKALGL